MLTEGMLVWDKFLYYPAMGMFFDMYPIKRSGNEKEFNDLVDAANVKLKALPHSQAWFATLFLRDNQIVDLPADLQASLQPKSYMMMAKPTFTGAVMPSIGVWNPVHFVWVSNRKVVFELYKGSAEDTVNWLGYRFRVVPPTDVEAWKGPTGSLSYAEALNQTQPDTGDGGTTPTPTTGVKVINMTCPNCGQKLGF